MEENIFNVTKNANKRRYYYSSAYCCVPQCHSRLLPRKMQQTDDEKFSFHRFPNEKIAVRIEGCRKANLRAEWKRRLRLGKRVTNAMRVCSRHFKRTDFILPAVKKKKRLKRNAYPTLCIPFFSTRIKCIVYKNKKFTDKARCAGKAKHELPIIQDSEDFSKMDDNEILQQGKEVYTCILPGVLCLKESELTAGGYEVWSLEDIPIGIRFGPYQGIFTDLKKCKKNGWLQWQEERKGKEIMMLGKWDERESNWLQYVNFTCSEEEQNLLAIESLSGLYYVASKPIRANTELLVWHQESLFKNIKGYKINGENADGMKEGLVLNCICKCENVKKCTPHTRNECQHLFSRSEVDNKKFQAFESRGHIMNSDIEKIIYVINKTNTEFISRVNGDYDSSISGKKFITRSTLEEHESTHIGKKPYKCNKYRKKFNTQSTLVVRKMIHTDKKPFKCNIYEERLDTNNRLIMHERIHTGEKPFECNMLDKKFSTGSKLVMHKRIHTGEKPYKCNICDNKFNDRSNLVVHKRIHSGEKPFECKVYEKKFNTKNTLVLQKRIHTGEKPSECIVCEKRFSTKSTLVVHKRIHTGEKPFECKICQKKFNTESAVVMHERTQW